MARCGGSGPIALRLALAFIAVALLAVALLAGLTAAFAAADVSDVAAGQRTDLTKAMTVAASAAWEGTGSWASADLGPVLDAGSQIGADVQVVDNAGRVVGVSPGFSRGTLPVQRAAVVVRGHQVGRIAVRLMANGLPATDAVLRSALWRAIAGAARLPALPALLAGRVAARGGAPPRSRLGRGAPGAGH